MIVCFTLKAIVRSAQFSTARLFKRKSVNTIQRSCTRQLELGESTAFCQHPTRITTNSFQFGPIMYPIRE